MSESGFTDLRDTCPFCLLPGPFQLGIAEHMFSHMLLFAAFSRPHESQDRDDGDEEDAQSAQAQGRVALRSELSQSLRFDSPPTSDAILFSNPTPTSTEVAVDHDHASQDGEQQLASLQSFRTCDYESMKNRHGLPVTGSLSWFLDHPDFPHWIEDGQPGLRLIVGDPGCGKSVLARWLIDEHLLSNVSRHGATVCYFFFNLSKPDHSLRGALSAFLHQLLTQQTQLQKYTKLLQEIAFQNLTPAELWRVLCTAVADPDAKPVVCTIDALDECNEDDWPEFTQMLRDLYMSSALQGIANKLTFLVTFRPRQELESGLSPFLRTNPWIRLHWKGEGNLCKDKENASQFPTLAQIEHKILEVERRSCLWPLLARQELQHFLTTNKFADIREFTLKSPTATMAYRTLLQDVRTKDDISFAIFCGMMKLLVAARRLLSMDELIHAIPYTLGLNFRADARSMLSSIVTPSQLRAICGVVVYVLNSEVELLHPTLKDFMTSEHDPEDRLWKRPFTMDEAKTMMASVCIGSLLRAGPRRPSPFHYPLQDAFTVYALSHWEYHLSEVRALRHVDLHRLVRLINDCILESHADTYKQYLAALREEQASVAKTLSEAPAFDVGALQLEDSGKSVDSRSVHVGLLCALLEEAAAVESMLDKVYTYVEAADFADDDTYTVGNIGGEDVAVVCPGRKGNLRSTAFNLVRRFPSIRFVLSVVALPAMRTTLDLEMLSSAGPTRHQQRQV